MALPSILRTHMDIEFPCHMLPSRAPKLYHHLPRLLGGDGSQHPQAGSHLPWGGFGFCPGACWCHPLPISSSGLRTGLPWGTGSGPELVTVCPGRALHPCQVWPQALCCFSFLLSFKNQDTEEETDICRRHSHIEKLSIAIRPRWFPEIR